MSIETIAIAFPKTSFFVESRGIRVEIDPAKIPADVLTQVIYHGLKQKVSDAAANASAIIWQDVKGKDAPKPSRDQMAAFAETNAKAIGDQTLAMMQKALDALYAGQWQVRGEGGGTVTRMSDQARIAVDYAKADLAALFAKALPGKTKPTASDFAALGGKVAEFFKANEKRPTWNDERVLAYIASQKEAGKADYMQLALEELARREQAANAVSANLDEMFGDL